MDFLTTRHKSLLQEGLRIWARSALAELKNASSWTEYKPTFFSPMLGSDWPSPENAGQIAKQAAHGHGEMAHLEALVYLKKINN